MPSIANTERGEYTRWLLSYIGAKESKYIFLSDILNSIEFYWSIDNDRNRMVDARELRDEYISNYGDDVLDELPAAVTVLEVLVALAIRADMVIRETPYTWLMIFYENLGFDFLVDTNITSDDVQFVKSAVRKWLDRRFSPNGSGSPFRSSKHDVSKISMWDAMQWYLADEFGEDHI